MNEVRIEGEVEGALDGLDEDVTVGEVVGIGVNSIVGRNEGI